MTKKSIAILQGSAFHSGHQFFKDSFSGGAAKTMQPFPPSVIALVASLYISYNTVADLGGGGGGGGCRGCNPHPFEPECVNF